MLDSKIELVANSKWFAEQFDQWIWSMLRYRSYREFIWITGKGIYLKAILNSDR